ncbi:putative reverse transcriptase domain-containing protein [Tanacetum coccineum]
MPPRRFKKKSVRKIVEKRVAKAIEKYEKTRADSNNAGGSGSTNTGGTVVPEMHGCSYKTFMNGKPHSFKGTEGVVGLKRWFEKMEQVFEICKCAEDDKVKFAMCTFEGRALTWWNGNVQTLGLANANQIPWSNVKAMMTTEYCPATEIQRMEQELWTLTLKGDDIEAYNNRFHELALMCHELVPTEKKKIERYIRGFPERIKGNITSSKPATLHEAINMARELVEQAVQGRAARIGESNKRKWEDNQRNNNNNNHNYNNNHNSNNNRNRNNNHHQQQNRRQENVRAYAAAPTGGKILIAEKFTKMIGWHITELSSIVEKISGIPLPNGKILESSRESGKKGEPDHLHVSRLMRKSLMTYVLSETSPSNEFWLQEVQVPRHVDNRDVSHVDPSKVESVKNWKTPESSTEIRSFLGLAGYYRRPEGFKYAPKAMASSNSLTKQTKILEAHGEASKDLKAPAEWLRGLETHFERRADGGIYFFDRIWIPSIGGVRKLIMDEAYTSRYSVHPGADKMYYDLRDLYWWPGIKRDIAEYVSRCLMCSKIKAEHQKPSGLLQKLKIPEWKWEKITWT